MTPSVRATLQRLSRRRWEWQSLAIEKAKTEKPDLILMDVVMPDMDGFQATRAITRDEQTKHIPVIMCTSKNQETDKVWGMRQGARDYIVKPVDADELVAKIKAFD